jgi:hypothetical protein
LVSVPLPQFDLAAAVELLIVIPVGKLSVKEKEVSALSAGAVKIIRNRVLPPAVIVVRLKVLDPVIGTSPVVIDVLLEKAAVLLIVVPAEFMAVTEPIGIVFV